MNSVAELQLYEPSLKSSREFDPLLQCFLIVSRFFGHAFSPATVTAGLPIGSEGLDLKLLSQACENLGFSSKIVERPLNKVSTPYLPAIIALQDGQYCVVVSLPRSRRGKAEIILPEQDDTRRKIAMTDLMRLYDGKLLLIQPKIRVDERVIELAPATKGNWFWAVIRGFTPTYAEILIAAAIGNLMALVIPLFTMAVYDRVVPNRAYDTLWVLAIGAAAAFGFDFVLRLLRAYFIDHVGKVIDKKVSARIFSQIMNISMAELPRSAGALASRVRDFEMLRDFFTSATLVSFIDLPFVILFIAVVFMVGGWIALIPLAALPIVLLIGIAIQFPMKRAMMNSMQDVSQKHAVLIEAINGIETIKLASASGRMQKIWEDYVAIAAESAASVRKWSSLAIGLTTLVTSFVTVAVLVAGVYRIDAGEMTVGMLVASTMLAGRAMVPLGQISGLLVRLQQARGAMESLRRIMEAGVERKAGLHYTQPLSFDGGIEFRNVSFSYPGEQRPILGKLSFKIAPGEKVAIIGRIGSGKTTVLRLVSGLFRPQEGTVLIDGIDINQIDPVFLRDQIGTVSQDGYLFYGSVKDNVALGLTYFDERRFLGAAQVSGLDQITAAHPRGYEMQVGEGGRLLSGGQRQSVLIARAVLKEPKIFLMDEPTSAMDTNSEGQFRSRFAEVLPGRTLLLVTHRVSLLSLVDRLLVIDQGKLVADGPKDQVLETLMKGRIAAAAS